MAPYRMYSLPSCWCSNRAGFVDASSVRALRFDRGIFVAIERIFIMTMLRSALRPRAARQTVYVAAALSAALVLTACGDKSKQAGAAGAGAGAPPEVGVVEVQPGAVPLTTDLPGRLEASRLSQIRARAAGILLKRHFEEGSDVKAGQLLFTIDSAPYRATLSSAQANLAQASALARRYRPLVEANAVSKQEYDAAVAAEKAARAQVETARINLGYANVTAPISGRIGRALVTEGALVGQGDVTHLATIQQINPLYINLNQSANEVLQMRQALRAGQLVTAEGAEAAKVDVILESGETYAHSGRLLFTDLTVDPGTGQVSLRAEVPNPDQLLLPGMYVRVRLHQAQADNAILLPQQAVTRGNQGDVVLVVGADGSFQPRPVKIGQAQGSNWVVLDGLKPGEKVIVDGFTRLRPGVNKVTPVPAGSKGGKPAAGSAPAAASAQQPAQQSTQQAAQAAASGSASAAAAVAAASATPAALAASK